MAYNIASSTFRFPDTAKPLSVISSSAPFDATATGQTQLYNVISINSVVITHAIIKLITVTSFVSAGSISIGSNGMADDIIPTTSLLANVSSQLDTAGLAFCVSTAGSIFTPAPLWEVISVNMVTPYTATTATISIDLLGYLI